MNNQIEAAIKEVEKFNDSIKETLNVKNISNSGEAARSLYVDFGVDFVRSIGIFYIEFLDTGRGSGKFPPLRPIQDWVQSKLGISSSEPNFDGIVYAVAEKIARLGTEIFRDNSKGLEIEKKILTLRQNLNDALRESTILTIKQRLNRFKTAHLKNKYGL